MPKATVLQGSVFDVLPTIAKGSIDCAVTSPPYFRLRSYLAKDHPLKSHELGSEPTPQEFIANMVRVFALVHDALADHGTCWVNIGDSYGYDSKWGGATGGKHVKELHGKNGVVREDRAGNTGLADGSMCLIPQRLAIALQEWGWTVRSIVVWQKPSAMPASLYGWQWRRCRVKKAKGKRGGEKGRVEASGAFRSPNSDHDGKDFAAAEYDDCPGCPKCSPNGGYVLRRGSWRPTSSYEPVLMLTKGKYYGDGEAVKTPPAAATVSRDKYTRVLDDPDEQFAVAHDHETLCDGANLRDVWKIDLEGMTKEELIALIRNSADGSMPDVWTIAAQPLKEKHYAAFPCELVYRCLKASTSQKGYCPTCGLPWCRVVDVRSVPHPGPRSEKTAAVSRAENIGGRSGGGNQAVGSASLAPEIQTLEWRPSCECPPAEPRPGVVLDLFAGSGRTLIAARRLGLDAVGIELNPDYAVMCERLVREDMPLFS